MTLAMTVHTDDVDEGVMEMMEGAGVLAVDTETSGLNFVRDRLMLVQIGLPNGDVHIVKYRNGERRSPNLCRVLLNKEVVKIFHFARFDMAICFKDLGVRVESVFCTKIASKLVRTYTSDHGLSDLCLDLLGVKLDKGKQSSDWGREDLSDEQYAYAAGDVKYLHELRKILSDMLAREGREGLAVSCFSFLSTRVELDLRGWGDNDIFAHR